MDCSSIDVDYDSGDGTVTMLKDKMVTARKEHKCHECYAVIPKGEQYKLHVYKWDGSFEERKTCISCLSVIKEMFSGCYMFGDTWEELENHVDEMFGDISEQCLISLHPQARNKLCDMIEAYHENNKEDEDNEENICWEVLTISSEHSHIAFEKQLSVFQNGYDAGMKDAKIENRENEKRIREHCASIAEEVVLALPAKEVIKHIRRAIINGRL